uniref:Uncharacterized protein n=1 Tax=Anguilla anguilla TaxID=7936 RepID=A0A0E9TAJ3_ANGAN
MRTHRRNQFMQLNWLPVESRATQLKLCQVHKIVKWWSPELLIKLLPAGQRGSQAQHQVECSKI